MEATFGPYLVEATIGRGGMGVVYRARHRMTGAQVALKTVRLQSPGMLASFRREVHVLSRLRHPGVVRILDHGLSDGTPWYAMELLEVPNLAYWRSGAAAPGRADAGAIPVAATTVSAADRSRVSAHAGPVPPTPFGPQLCQVFRGICEALSFLHSHGVIHRDLKPENILIKPGAAPVLVDFGIVAQFAGSGGREVLDLTDAATGTLAYMAPEQRLNRFVDARADLFSLGCILYECLTGLLPFGLAGLFNLAIPDPPAPSACAPALPPELDALVLRLLAKNAEDRMGYAEDVDRALAKLDGSDASPPRKRRTGYLYRPEFAGRTDVLKRLLKNIAVTESGRGVRLLVTGESGVGKTRLALELAAKAAERGFNVITGECSPVGLDGLESGGLGAPLHAFRGLLLAVADDCRARGPELTRLLLGQMGKLLAAYEPALSDLPGVEKFPDEIELSPQGARARLFNGLKTLIAEYARDRPLLLVIDDVQWADDLSLELLGSLDAGFCAQAPVALVVLCRAEQMPPAVQALTSVAEFSVEHLERFERDRDAVQRMVAGMLALRSAPKGLVEFLGNASNGNPFFIAEYLRAAITQGVLVRDHEGRWDLRAVDEASGLEEQIPAPPTIAAVVEMRLRGLDDFTANVVYAAAVLGRGFDVDLVARTADRNIEDILDVYGALRQRQILEEDASGLSRFVHDKLREIAYAQIDPPQLVTLHRRAASAIEARYAGNELEAMVGALGYHHSKAGASDQAALYFARAGDRARTSYANRDAVRFYRLALAQLESQGRGGTDRASAALDQWSRIQESLGDQLLLGGEVADARSAFAASLERTPRSDSVLRARRRRKLARTWERQHHHVEALAVYALAEEDLGESLPLVPPPEWWHERVQIEVDRAWDLYWLARVEELEALVERVRPLIEQHGSAVQRGQFFQALVHMNLRRDRYGIADETIEYARASLNAAEQTDGVGELALARFFLAFPLMFRGREAEAEPLFITAIAGAERVGDATLQTRFLSYYSILHRRLGRVAEVRQTSERARTIAARGAMFDYVGVSHANLCWAAWREGDGADVEAHASEAFSAWGNLPPAFPYPLQWLLRMPLAAFLAEKGRRDEAIEHWKFLVGNTQHLLPAPLREAISAAVAAQKDADPAAREATTEQVATLSREFRYL